MADIPATNLEEFVRRLRDAEDLLDLDTGDLVADLLNRTASNRLNHADMFKILDDLPKLTEDDLDKLGHHDSVCPICFNTLLSALAEEEMAVAMDSPAHPLEELGVTQLHKTCGHVFCRRDITKWIRGAHDSCPMCRRSLLPSQSSSSNSNNNNNSNISDAEPIPTPDLTQLMRQIQQQITFLAPAHGAVSLHLHDESSLPEPIPYESSRDDFAGMYS